MVRGWLPQRILHGSSGNRGLQQIQGRSFMDDNLKSFVIGFLALIGGFSLLGMLLFMMALGVCYG